jgi:hypothetical protein
MRKFAAAGEVRFPSSTTSYITAAPRRRLTLVPVKRSATALCDHED